MAPAMVLLAWSAAVLRRVLVGLAILLLFTGPLLAGVVVYAAGWSAWHWLWVWPALIAAANICTSASQVSGRAALRFTPPEAPWRHTLECSVARSRRLGPQVVPRPVGSPPT
jgi:hypothetical protein